MQTRACIGVEHHGFTPSPTTAKSTMLSRTLRRALLDSQCQLPPTFLLPWTANLSTVPRPSEALNGLPPNTRPRGLHAPARKFDTISSQNGNMKPAARRNVSVQQTQQSLERSELQIPATSKLPPPTSQSDGRRAQLVLSRSVRDLLPILQAQAPHYITAHIHGFPYLLTQGDTVRLPFLMEGVEPGDVIRLNRAINLGSRDLTLKAPAPSEKIKSPATSTRHVVDATTGDLASHANVMPGGSVAPHFIPHIAKGKHSYIDDRLFVCRAVVMGVESEPLRIKEKTKRRQRHVRKVKSKHRYTILKIKELKVKTPDEIESDWIEEE